MIDIRVTWVLDPGASAAAVVENGIAQGGTPNSITLAPSAVSVNNYCYGLTLAITGGTGAGQESQISAYNGTSKVASVATPWQVVPDSTSTYSVFGINQISAWWFAWRPSTMKAMTSAGVVHYGVQAGGYKNAVPVDAHWSDAIHYVYDALGNPSVFILQPGDVVQCAVSCGAFMFGQGAPHSPVTAARSLWLDPHDGSTEPQPVYPAGAGGIIKPPLQIVPSPLSVTMELIP